MELIKITAKLLAQLDYVPILVASLVVFVFGFLWYGPFFGKQWMKYIGVTESEAKKVSQKKMIPAYLVTFIGNFITVTFLMFLSFVAGTTFWHMALLIWVGFIVFDEMGAVFWMKKPWGFFGINAGYRILMLLLAGYILSLFL